MLTEGRPACSTDCGRDEGEKKLDLSQTHGVMEEGGGGSDE